MSTFDNLKYKFQRFTIAEKLIVLNVLFFVIPFFLQTLFYLFNIPSTTFLSWFHLLPSFTEVLFRPWTLITYSFLHGNFMHILWNMILLYFVSRMYLNLFSEQQFLKNYLLGVLAGGLVFLIGYNAKSRERRAENRRAKSQPALPRDGAGASKLTHLIGCGAGTAVGRGEKLENCLTCVLCEEPQWNSCACVF